MNEREIERVAAAVMYEGYLLYPYRLSVKNVRRWTFGTVPPGGAEIRSEVLVEGSAPGAVTARIRFLQVQQRTVRRAEGETFSPVESLEVSGVLHVPWQEGIEREVVLGAAPLHGLSVIRSFRFDSEQRREFLREAGGKIAGVVDRDTGDLAGRVELRAEPVRPGLFRLAVALLNESAIDDPTDGERRSFMAVHAILHVDSGRFLSLTDPPAADVDPARSCRNVGLWPVLIGDPASVLCSPIILPDYPRLAEESPGDLFDGTEIDEILSLRIRTLTESEKREMASIDPRARAILQRTEALARRELASLHGAWRSAGEARHAT